MSSCWRKTMTNIMRRNVAFLITKIDHIIIKRHRTVYLPTNIAGDFYLRHPGRIGTLYFPLRPRVTKHGYGSGGTIHTISMHRIAGYVLIMCAALGCLAGQSQGLIIVTFKSHKGHFWRNDICTKHNINIHSLSSDVLRYAIPHNCTCVLLSLKLMRNW